MKTAALILAAGQGKRMRSALPKVLHPVGDEPLVVHVVKLAITRRCSPIVVVIDPNGARVRELLVARFPKAPLVFATQHQALGTGDAARVGLAAIPKFKGRVLILCGDVPMLQPTTLAALEKAKGRTSLAVLTARVPDPTGYGRIVRTAAGTGVERIVEHRDATPAELDIHEINAGVYVVDEALLRRAVRGLSANNDQGELYLTDVVPLAAASGGARAHVVEDAREVRGVNTRVELAEAEATYRERLVRGHQLEGVTFRDPTSVLLGARAKIGGDAIIGVGVQLLGSVEIGAGARVEGPSVLENCTIAPGAVVESFSHIDGAYVGPGAHVGPYARLRPGAQLGEGARVGNFVEVKKSRLGKGVKANHLAYLGDAEIGEGTNVGAGTITCNYDGVNKHPTRLGAGVFVGSNTTLVAPVEVGDGAYVAAGSTVTKNVPADALAFGRARQENREGYAKRLRAMQKRGKAKH